MTNAQAQQRAILNVISEAAASGRDLPEIKNLAEMMGIPYQQFTDRLYGLLLKNLVASERKGVYTINGVDVYFGPRDKKRPKRAKPTRKRSSINRSKPEPAARYISFQRQCLCCGETFNSKKRVFGDLVTTIYRLCGNCRTGNDIRDKVEEPDTFDVQDIKSTMMRMRHTGSGHRYR